MVCPNKNIFFSLLLITIMGPLIIGIWAEKSQREAETFPGMAGVENMTTGSPGDSSW